MTTREAIFDRLMREAIDAIPNAAALHKAGLLIDLAGDLSREDGTARALQLCDELAARKLRPSQRANLEYLRANAWHNRERTRHTDRSAVWAWEQPELQNQILHLRRAATLPGFEKLSGVRRCQILTNLANQFSTIGRFVDAVESWDRALVINARFGMALGNRGHGIRSYAQSLYDPGHQRVFLSFAHAGLAAALSPRAQYHGGGYENAKTFFHSEMKQIESAIDVRRPIDLDGDDLGASKDERAYRDWCLQNPLFLNPLNDLGARAIAAQDILMLPTYVTEIGEPPTFSGFFNQMKQEFVSARSTLHKSREGLSSC
jgi:hypothetical protein